MKNNKIGPMSEREQGEEIFAAFGEYAMKFEYMNHYIRTGCHFLLTSKGLGNFPYQQAITSDINIGSLLQLLQSFLINSKKHSIEEEKIISKIINVTRNLIEIRNNLIHRTYPIGFYGVQNKKIEKIVGVKSKNKKKGVKSDTINLDVEFLHSEIEKIVLTSSLLQNLYLACASGRNLTNHFEYLPAEDKVILIHEVR